MHRPPALEQCDSALLGSLTVSSSDAQPWIYLASFHAARGDREKVLQAMKSAIQSDFYGNGYAERVSRLSDIINQNTSWGLYSAVVAAIGIEASNSVFPQDVFSFCRKASSDLYTATLCYQLGEDMALRGKTLALSGVGQSLTTMMRNVSEFHLPNDSVVNITPDESADMLTIAPLMKYHDRLLLNWLDDLKALGEKQAAGRAIETVRTLAKSGDYSHCAD
ncbi:hypothetical protein [Alteromonas sp. H39]|uniref:hypothetical protein n=1 Tax=Alteromonas sp. H39 TaxID=3389876 RepID=UPI0039DF4B0B